VRDACRCHTVKVGSKQKQRTFPAGTSQKKIQDWIDEARVALRAGRTTPVASSDTLKDDARRYLGRMKATLAKASYNSRVCEIEAWLPALGHLPRYGEGSLTRDHFIDVRNGWRTPPDGTPPKAPKTCNHRLRAMKHLYRELDGTGRHGATPMDTIPKLKEPPSNPQFVDVKVIKRVASRIADVKTRARFMVLASTGQRPAQLMRALPTDIDLRRGVWMVRAAKGGNLIPLILTDDMKAAFRIFITVNAWGHFDTSDHAKRLYAAGWPRDVRPYNAKHTVAITLANTGAEWEDLKDFFGHTDIKTTRIYTGQVLNRLRKTSARLAGRIGW
jgi:integrase